MEEVTTTEDTQRKRGREDDTVNVDDGASTSAVAATTTTTRTDAVVSTVEDLKCGICLELVENATQTSCCGGLWCRGCIEQIEEKKCPNCRADIEDDTVTRDTRSERLSAALSRSCKNEPRGCSFSGNRREMHEHSQTCQHASLDELRAELAAAKANLTGIEKNYKELQGNKSALVALLESKSPYTMDQTLTAALGYDHILAVLLKEGLVHIHSCRLGPHFGSQVRLQLRVYQRTVYCYASVDAGSSLDRRKIRLVELNSIGREERSLDIRLTTGVEPSTGFPDSQFSLDKKTVYAIKLLR